jgi:hypothetical protein
MGALLVFESAVASIRRVAGFVQNLDTAAILPAAAKAALSNGAAETEGR